MEKINVAVLLGGFSAEREVSMRSGQAAAKALRSVGVQVTEVDVRDENFSLPDNADVAFVALHGTGGEDGVVQAILERKGIPFTGSGAEASRVAFDKVESKKVFRQHGLRVANDVTLEKKNGKDAISGIKLKFPVVVKPARQGSSVGIRIVKSRDELQEAVEVAFQNDDLILIEEFIAGKEMTVGILGEKAMAVIEIRPKDGWYDYKNKYTVNATEYLVPAPIDAALTQLLQEEALKAHRSLGCRDVSRADFRIDVKGLPYLLEVNTIPGMTETSLLPKAAAAMGISFPQVCLDLVHMAHARGGKIA
jgi:D-alanine-D-alanine ligase